jgi:hypothetical protein
MPTQDVDCWRGRVPMRMRRSQPSLSAMPLFRPGATLLTVIQHVKAGID